MGFAATGTVKSYSTRDAELIGLTGAYAKTIEILRWVAIILLGVFAGFVMFSVQLFGAPIIDIEYAFFPAFLLFAASLFGFLMFGGRTITPLSLMFLAFAINLGCPAIYTVVVFGHDQYQATTSLSLFLLLIAFFVTKHRTPSVPSIRPGEPWSLISPATFAGVLLFVYVGFLLLFIFEPFLKVFWRPVIALFPSAFAIAAFYALSSKRWLLSVLLVFSSVGAVVIYLSIAFDLFGRLNVAALLLSIVIIGSWVRPGWVYKLGILATVPVGLAWAGFHRAPKMFDSFGLETGRQVFETGAGLGSILAPFTTLSETVAQSSLWGIRPSVEWLDQLVFVFLFWIPRIWWPGKPEGFGRLMVYELRPDLSNSGHSMAASIYGEFVYYAGFLGPLIGTVLLIGVIRLFVWAQELVVNSTSSVWMIYYAMLAYMLGQLMTLVWGGPAAFVVRGITPLIGLSGLFLVWWVLRRVGSTRTRGS